MADASEKMRTPLVPVRSMAGVLLKEISNHSKEKVQSYDNCGRHEKSSDEFHHPHTYATHSGEVKPCTASVVENN